MVIQIPKSLHSRIAFHFLSGYLHVLQGSELGPFPFPSPCREPAAGCRALGSEIRYSDSLHVTVVRADSVKTKLTGGKRYNHGRRDSSSKCLSSALSSALKVNIGTCQRHSDHRNINCICRQDHHHAFTSRQAIALGSCRTSINLSRPHEPQSCFKRRSRE